MNKLGLILLLLAKVAKGHKKLNKGNSAEPFVYGGYATCLARVKESVGSGDKRRCAYERERERESSKLFGTTK